jgi:hypothetical protein
MMKRNKGLRLSEVRTEAIKKRAAQARSHATRRKRDSLKEETIGVGR